MMKISLLVVLTHALSVEEPIQLVRPNGDHSGFEVVTESLTKLAAFGSQKKIAVVSVVGPYHSGKSFLMNALIGRTDVFSIGPKTSPETLGLWVCRTKLTLPAHKDTEVWFIDSEGFFGPQIEETYDAKTFTLAMLLGDEFVYNTVKIIDAQAVNMLEMLARRAQLFRVKSMSQLSRLQSLPHLTWVVEDFVQVDSAASSNTRWLESYLKSQGDVPYLKKIFPSLSVRSLFLPATSREALSDLSKVPFAELTAEFRKDLKALRASILDSLNDKIRFSTISEFSQTLYFLAKALDRGNFPELPSLWHSWQSEVVNSSLTDSFDLFQKALTDTLNSEHIVSSEEFNRLAGAARNASLLLYSELVKDFLAEDKDRFNALLHALDQQLGDKYRLVLLDYTEKVKNHIEKRSKAIFSTFLTSVRSVFETDLMEPSVLRAKLQELALASVAEFGSTVDRFVATRSDHLPQDWECASLPVFKMEPTDALRIELQNQIDLIVKENDKSVSNLIKASWLTASNSVDGLLTGAAGKLFSSSEMSDFVQQVVLPTALAAYDAELGVAWMQHVSPQYEEGVKEIRKSVKQKTDKFESAHQDLLFEWFRKSSEKALTVYKDLKRTIEQSRLPCEEELMEKEHEKAVSALIHALDVELGAAKFKDSQPYLETRARLEALVDTELSKLRKKNIELWKVHSDEATQCASELNLQYTDLHCPQGWFCWFRIWPGAFKTRSREHLLQCLGKDTLSAYMREQVFESWFEKELAKDAAEVRNNMWVAIVSLLVPVVWIVYIKRGGV